MPNINAAMFLSGVQPTEDDQVKDPNSVRIMSGTVLEASSNGEVKMELGGDIYGEETAYATISTLGGLEESDDATILLIGEEGRGMYPLALGSMGSIDRVRDSVTNAMDAIDALDADDVGAVPSTVKTAQVSLSNLGSGTKILYLYRQGSFVFAQMNATTAPSSANTAISAGTVPLGYRPVRNVGQGGPRVSNSSLNGTYRWTINTSGAITFLTSSTGTYETPMALCWYTTNAFPS